jgi:hypothetical protein
MAMLLGIQDLVLWVSTFSKLLFNFSSDEVERTWAGLWMSAQTGEIMQCSYELQDVEVRKTPCGAIDCTYMDVSISLSKLLY